MQLQWAMAMGAAWVAFGGVERLGAGDDQVDFKVGGKLAARYQTGPTVVRPIFWPVHAPSGAVLTANGPKDHPHHKSIWFCHGDVIPEGIELKNKIKGIEGVDFWSERKGQGRIVCGKEQLRKERGDKEISITTKNEWRTGDDKKIMDETRIVQFHNLGKAWLIVLDIDLHASVCPITFGDTKEGAMAVRVNELIQATKGGKIENADGKKGEKECRGQKSAWCDYSGTIDGKAVGIAIFDDPKNPHPACWHVRDYGLMAANPFARAKSGLAAVKDQKELVRLAKGEHLRLRYGVLLHEGNVRSGNVADHYRRFLELRGKE